MLGIIIFYILLISSFTLLGSFYVRRFNKPDMLIGLYVAFVVIAQILATKISLFDFGFVKLIGPSGVLVFSLTYLFTDIVNEKFGLAETKKMILIGLISQIAMSCFLWIGIKMTPAPFWSVQDVWSGIFSLVPRITLASYIAFIISENVDAYIFDWFKKVTKGKNLWMRNVFSSLPSLLLDSFIFVPLAFWGLAPLGTMIIGQTALKWLVGVISIPFMYLNKYVMGEGK